MEAKEVKETIEGECVKKEYEKKIEDYRIRIELEDDIIIFTLLMGLCFNKYKKEYKYDELIKELELSQYKDIIELFEYLTENAEYEVLEKEQIIKINGKKIRLNEKELTKEELIKVIMEEMKDLKNKNKELIKENEDKDKRIKILEDNYSSLKDFDINEENKCKNEIMK